eukprot:gnl/TRDRNA2_/TRDRNA2_186004_c0_seq1.p1 gnl/TRDRNA2_/TRDRNA2_186004_c0~~gnl/TRDRNA2_/TRDRNA2_186004_c0_seq1.p1  ORF type:complete len:467 (-),score=110.02 gnl/TRDRNA2_/TRDRNA2_186004_c0_seq1:52-1383(-)
MAAVKPEDQEHVDLLGFLQDPKPEVQRLAAEGVFEQTANEDFLRYCRENPRSAAKPLLRLVERAEAAVAKGEQAAEAAASASSSREAEKAQKAAEFDVASATAAGSAALQALVNISSIPTVRDELVELSAPRRCTEALRNGWLEGRADLAHWYAMLLANITTVDAGQKAICGEETLLRFLFAAYTAKPRPPPRDGYDDPLCCLGKLLMNSCAQKEGRRVLAIGDGGVIALTTLSADLADRTRRPDVLGALRNLCLDEECHSAIAQTDLMKRMAGFLYPWETAESDRRSQLPASMQEFLEAEKAALTTDVAIRSTAAGCIFGLTQTKEGREYLRSNGCYEVMRAWHLEETETNTKELIELAVPRVHYTEEEIEKEKAEEAKKKEEEAQAATAAPKEEFKQPPKVVAGPLPEPDAKAAENAGTDKILEGIFDGIEGAGDGDAGKK